ncbi:diaminopimelate epimerase [Rubrivivax albus]|uniref:Diaminopimelate epimerase n=1 Tax=Rubrivivax albus TaxID=2499835 RepID=A0A437JVZ9_9BURK|nr:diaminopimelate epimerase [Rubrivivax albus]RVT51547.1 diaminopimelate epimerase [Rubrivivax albus]
MRLPFTKMHGAGNDFVVLDATRAPLALDTAQLQRLGDRRFGVGADQILVVEPAPSPDVDFGYRIFNGASGAEVEHCGNGARCFVRYVRGHGLTDKASVRVRTVNRVLELTEQADGRVTVDMGAPAFEPSALPFDPAGLTPRVENGFPLWPLAVDHHGVEVAVLSMGNPHAVLWVDDVDTAPVATVGPAIENHPRFARRVNVGFLQVVSRQRVRLRVHERDAGETLACGTGACAAVVAGIRLGWLDSRVDAELRGGTLTIEWAGGAVRMTGPAETVYEGEIEL